LEEIVHGDARVVMRAAESLDRMGRALSVVKQGEGAYEAYGRCGVAGLEVRAWGYRMHVEVSVLARRVRAVIYTVGMTTGPGTMKLLHGLLGELVTGAEAIEKEFAHVKVV
jgi:hypothetical protein